MAKGIYVGVGGVARKVKKLYVGVGGVARKVKKAYIGVNGVARLMFSAGLSYGNTTPLSIARYGAKGVSTPSYMLFTCGLSGEGYQNAQQGIDAYSKSLVKSTTSISDQTYQHAVAPIGQYGIISCGMRSGSWNKNTDAINDSLVHSAITQAPEPSSSHCGCGNGGHAVFVSSSLTGAYNTSLVMTPQGYRFYNGCSSARISNYALFLGGQNYSDYINTTLISIDSSLTYKYMYPTKAAKRDIGGASIQDKYALFAGGRDFNYNVSKEVVAINPSLVMSYPAELGAARSMPVGVSLPEYALFVGGSDYYLNVGGNVGDTDVYDVNLVRTSGQSLSPVRTYSDSTSLGGVSILAGGKHGTTYYSDANVFEC